MAATALQRCVSKFIPLLINMAGIAIHIGVNTDERKPRPVMPVQHLLPVFPVARRMAVLAPDSQFSPMNVGMTIRTGAAGLDKLQGVMAFPATKGAMGPDERETGFLMPEAHRIRPNRPVR